MELPYFLSQNPSRRHRLSSDPHLSPDHLPPRDYTERCWAKLVFIVPNMKLYSALDRWCPALCCAGRWRDPRACRSVPEAYVSSLTSGNILGVLTWGYKLRNGPLRCDLFVIKTMLLNAHKMIHPGESTSPGFSGQAWQ